MSFKRIAVNIIGVFRLSVYIYVYAGAVFIE